MRYASALISTLAVSLIAANAAAGVTDRLFDFTDAYYLSNGIDPTKLAGRKQAPSASAVIDTPFFSYQRNVRVIGTSGGYGASGDIRYFVVMAGYGPDAFTNNAAGQNAKMLSEKYIEYVFPSQGADPVGLGNARQSVVLDTSQGYFSANPLGLWLHVWISYTPRAFDTSDGRKMLDDLKKKNGLAKDGTPIIKTKSEIDNLFSKGYITKKYRNDSLRYAVCPIIRDPRDGGIAPDAFLNFTKYADRTPVEPWFVQNFTSLQRTGNWFNP
ncbi:MAG TPA: hypothetical protein VEX38_08970 [Fimbriimonadaceae bacterium]|nr:hypothetical protein [Fimbriimonadaceae bacterium]